MKRFKQFIGLLLITALLLLALEAVSFWVNQNAGSAQPFLINPKLMFQKNYRQLEGYGYRLVDPLLGWGLTPDAVAQAGFELRQHTVLIPSRLGCSKPLKIWISGGSTSDVVINKSNWPTLLATMLKEHGICAEVYVAATGGYSSGQELLKLIRDGTIITPDICLSYSGANEHVSPTYVSRQEYDLCHRAMQGQKPAAILPNTVYTIRERFLNTNTTLVLPINAPWIAENFWIQNMRMMNALCTENGWQFVGILQPVAGTAAYRQPDVEAKHSLYVNANQKHYPAMQAHADTTAYLLNYTAIFDTATQAVYTDDCHLHPAYQQTVAQHIFGLLIDSLTAASARH